MWRIASVTAAVALALAACAPRGQPERLGGTVSVLAVWGGEELESFRAMLQPFEERTGVTVEYEGTRDLNAVLTTRVQPCTCFATSSPHCPATCSSLPAWMGRRPR